MLIECFSEGNFGDEASGVNMLSEKFMELMIKVILEKKDRFQIKTLIHMIWSFSKTPDLSSNPQIIELLKELRDYDRLRQSISTMF